MNSEPVVRVKTESFEHFLDPFLSESRNNSAFADLSNRRINECLDCNDEVDYECPSCICQVCLYQTSAEKRYRCFICHKVFHESCRNNPELASSTGRWLCFECKNREKLYSSSFRPHAQPVLAKEDKRNTPMAVVKTEKLDWNGCESEKMDCSANKTCTNGKVVETKPDENTSSDTKDDVIDKVARGFFTKMNNARRKKICKSVPSNHFGPIPGIPVGTCWKYRLQVSESGIHRPVVAGISGREVDGAYSIVLSGAYSEDPDFGEEFFYSGCGGRDKYPHKRMAAQTLDQSLTRYNKALALSCNAPFNDLVGAEAVDWRAGKPVRVIRNYKLRKYSEYAPIEGNRYDGIYKVVKYFPVINHVGLLVWKYLLRRDDPEPAPWTDEGKRIIEEKNLRVIWPCDSDSENEDTKPIVDKIERPLKRVAYNVGNSNQLLKMKACHRPYLKPQMNPTSLANRLPCKQAYNGTYIKTEPNQFPNPGQLHATPGTYAKPGTSQFANTGRLYNRAAYNGTYIKSEANQFNPVSQFPSIAPYNAAYLKPAINQRAGVNRLPSMEAYNGAYLKSQVNQFSDASRLPTNAYNGTYIKSEVIHLPDVDPLNACTGPPKPEMNQFASRLPAYNGAYIKSEISQWSHATSLEPYDGGTYIKSEPQEFADVNRLPALQPYDGTYFKSGVNQLANANRFPNWEAYIRTLWNSDISQLPPILNAAPNPAPVYGGQPDIKPNVNLLQANLFKQQPCYSYTYNWHREICATISAPIEPAAPFSCSLASARSQEPPGGATSCDAECWPPADADSAVLPSVPSTLDSAKNNNDHDYANMNFTTSDDCEPSNDSSAAGSVSVKQEAHELPASFEKLIDMDTSNEKVWAYCKTYLKKSEREFSDVVKLLFSCRYCWKLVNRPITTPCDHNVCLECINNHFSKKLFSCPHCHEFLGPTFEIVENKNLACALENLFPGYNLKIPTFVGFSE